MTWHGSFCTGFPHPLHNRLHSNPIGILREGAVGTQIRNGSPADTILREAQLHHSDMGQRWMQRYNSPHTQSRRNDIAFFAGQIR